MNRERKREKQKYSVVSGGEERGKEKKRKKKRRGGRELGRIHVVL